MLGEIYAWFTSNMKGRIMLHESPQEPQIKPQGLTFSLHPGNLESYDCICDNASFNFEWLENTNNPVFKCNCQLRRTAHGDIHDEELAQYFSMFINASSSSCIDLIPPFSMPYELDCPLRWTSPIMEDMAFLWQNIPTHLFDNTKYKPNWYARLRILL